MIVKFLEPSANFRGVYYNTDKVAQGKAELIAAVNFDALQALNEIRPKDYWHYLKALSARNKAITEPQLHVAISTNEKDHDKHELTAIAAAWLEKMGYSKKPYLIFFHKDTEHNHVHIVSTRVDHDGRKNSSGFERVRGLQAMNQIMGIDEDRTARNDIDKALTYRCSTIAQFKLVLEKLGYTIKDNDLIRSGKKVGALDYGKVDFKALNQNRAAQLKAIFKKYAPRYDQAGLTNYLKTRMGVELVFHSREGKPAYGYTVIDHAQKNVYKGSEILPLQELMQSLNSTNLLQKTSSTISQKEANANHYPQKTLSELSQRTTGQTFTVNIAKDVDDDQVHGPRRRRKRKARTNTR